MDIKDCFEERFLMSPEESKKKYEEYAKQVLENLTPKIVRKNKIPKLDYLPIPEAEEQERMGERNYDDEMVNTALDTVIEAAEKYAKIADMLEGTIDHLNGDDAKDLLVDIKWEIKRKGE